MTATEPGRALAPVQVSEPGRAPGPELALEPVLALEQGPVQVSEPGQAQGPGSEWARAKAQAHDRVHSPNFQGKAPELALVPVPELAWASEPGLERVPVSDWVPGLAKVSDSAMGLDLAQGLVMEKELGWEPEPRPFQWLPRDRPARKICYCWRSSRRTGPA